MRYSNDCLRLFVVILQDLHCLHRPYHNVDDWGIKLYHHTNFHQPSSQAHPPLRVYLLYTTIDLAFRCPAVLGLRSGGEPGHEAKFPYLAELLLVRYSNACLRLFCTRFTWFTEILSQC